MGLPDAIAQYQIAPLSGIASDYQGKLNKVNDNHNNIKQKIDSITNANKTGVRDDLSGNKLYDYNTPFRVNKEKTVLDGLIHDNRQLEQQENAIYILGTITAATLIVFAIALGRE
jgi:hypothetical protein